MSLITRQRVLAIAGEGTPGTAETLNAATGVMNCYETSFTPDLPIAGRESQGTYDAPLAGVQTTRGGKIAFKTDLIGHASTAPYWMSDALTACGFSLSTLTATANGSSNTTTSTVGVYQDGLFKSIVGAQGTLEIPFVVGEPLMGSFEYQGKYAAPTDTAIITPTYVTTNPPRVASATITLGGATLAFKTGSIKIENTIAMVPKDSDATGFDRAQITLQRITVTLDPEAALVATRDDYGLLLAGTTAAFSMAVGDTGNKLTFAIPACQRIDVGDGDRDGILTHPLTLLHTGASAMTIVAA